MAHTGAGKAWGDVQTLAEIVSEVSGVKVDVLDVVASLRRRRNLSGGPKSRVISIGNGHLEWIWNSMLNRRVSNMAARWALRAMGHDTPVRHVFPLYEAMVRARGGVPWRLRYFAENAWAFRRRAKASSTPSPEIPE